MSLNAEQLRQGAGGISYRAQQLAYAVLLMGVRLPDGIPKTAFDVISNCRVESVLVNARALTDFLGQRPKHNYLHYSHFKTWTGDVIGQTGLIFGVVSLHLSHPSLTALEDERHPGAWPLTELAVTLVGGLAEFLATDPKPTETFNPEWFNPDPVEVYRELRDGLQRVPATEVSERPEVNMLTTALQTYLLDKGVLIPTRPPR